MQIEGNMLYSFFPEVTDLYKIQIFKILAQEDAGESAQDPHLCRPCASCRVGNLFLSCWDF